MAAVGDSEGSITMIQLCKPLYEDIDGEKDMMSVIFEREGAREKNLAQAKRQAELTAAAQEKAKDKKDIQNEEDKKKERMAQ